ncbi:putative heme iron utilization protein [Parvibaculum indicum]|uniref:HugZ family pyridoxamine 5'-phosphate oxidase n=1 Tax=Parvibaculum indicum TaxID=562969 RepID=UPI0014247346|nr:pyridoxamine 5'-phosphate oxidase family protein [Parvibaculum indicum]NIJ42214.1 putative heme iron utilization protein [Parvibaculum indicum]
MSDAAKKKEDILQPTDDEARALVHELMARADYAAIAALDPATGHPLASRVALALDEDGTPVILTSKLAAHTPAIEADGRCSLLVGEPGMIKEAKGDPLTHPRLTVIAEAERVAHDSDMHARLRERWLVRHPKSKLYIDFPDFAFFRLAPLRGSLNGGFGKAYELTPSDMLSAKA